MGQDAVGHFNRSVIGGRGIEIEMPHATKWVVGLKPRQGNGLGVELLGCLNCPENVLALARAADGEKNVAWVGPKLDKLFECFFVAMVIGHGG